MIRLSSDGLFIDERWMLAVGVHTHPMSKASISMRRHYYAALRYYLMKAENSAYIKKALLIYQRKLELCKEMIPEDIQESKKRVLGHSFLHSEKNRYKEFLCCDLALILFNKRKFICACTALIDDCSRKQGEKLKRLLRILFRSQSVLSEFPKCEGMIRRYWGECYFLKLPFRKLMVTATMSAGKSTLINALIGKNIVRTSQECCTGNITYICEKDSEDGKTAVYKDEIYLDASSQVLQSIDWEKPYSIFTVYRRLLPSKYKLCVMDTPGVNSALNNEHVEISRKAIRRGKYDFLIYIMGQPGAEDEMEHLKWIAENVPKKKVIFVLNKVDNYKKEDSIEGSLFSFREDLMELGFENPEIFPLSAYYALLLKRKENGEFLTEDESDEYELYSKKFRKADYDLSRYTGVEGSPDDSEYIELSKKCGIFALEQKIYGGRI